MRRDIMELEPGCVSEALEKGCAAHILQVKSRNVDRIGCKILSCTDDRLRIEVAKDRKTTEEENKDEPAVEVVDLDFRDHPRILVSLSKDRITCMARFFGIKKLAWCRSNISRLGLLVLNEKLRHCLKLNRFDAKMLKAFYNHMYPDVIRNLDGESRVSELNGRKRGVRVPPNIPDPFVPEEWNRSKFIPAVMRRRKKELPVWYLERMESGEVTVRKAVLRGYGKGLAVLWNKSLGNELHIPMWNAGTLFSAILTGPGEAYSLRRYIMYHQDGNRVLEWRNGSFRRRRLLGGSSMYCSEQEKTEMTSVFCSVFANVIESSGLAAEG